MPEKILVTGGAGYIGSHAVRALQESGYAVTVYDNLSTGYEESIGGCDFVFGDVRDRGRLRDTFAGTKFAGVLHFAGVIEVGESVTDPYKYYDNNVSGSLVLLETMREFDVKNIIFSSTAAVYGEPKSVPVAEAAELAPINPYGHSKLMIEQMLTDAALAYGLRPVILRYFNVAGAQPDGTNGERKPQASHIITNCMRAASGLNPGLRIFGTDYPTPDGTCIRDYIHIADLARAHVAALEYLLAGGSPDIFNCGYGQGFSVMQVVDMVKKITGIDFNAELAPRRAGDPAILISDAKKIRKVLSWKPEFDDLEKIIADAWQWEKTRGS